MKKLTIAIGSGGTAALLALFVGCVAPAGSVQSTSARVEGEIPSAQFFETLFDIGKDQKAQHDADGQPYTSTEPYLDDIFNEVDERGTDFQSDDVDSFRSMLAQEATEGTVDSVLGRLEDLSNREQKGADAVAVLQEYEQSVQEELNELLGEAPTLNVPSNQTSLPVVRQQVNYSCGDVSALSLLRYWDPTDYASMPEGDLYAPMGTTPENGTEPAAIAAYINGVPGLSAQFQQNAAEADLLAAIDAGQPPIVDIQAWQGVDSPAQLAPWPTEWDDGHYVVLSGYDDDNFYFMDPSGDGDGYSYIPRDEFMDRWHDVLGLGSAAQQVQHMAVFVQGTGLTPSPMPAAPSQATPIY